MGSERQYVNWDINCKATHMHTGVLICKMQMLESRRVPSPASCSLLTFAGAQGEGMLRGEQGWALCSVHSSAYTPVLEIRIIRILGSGPEKQLGPAVPNAGTQSS